MKKAKRWLLATAVTALYLLLLTHETNAALPFKKVALATTTKSKTTSTTTTTTTTTEANAADEAAEDAVASEEHATATEEEESKADNTTKNSKLTGIPQIDYIWDPNLPRELRGYNLSSYPFLGTVPPKEDIHFKCDGLHDGFYASIEHKCQVYHHCVYGIRHDFLCANFTAFDQKTFICHFASDVDCEGSQRYWNRNDELYMATTTTSTTTTTTEPPPTPARRRPAARPQRPLRRPYNRRPIDDYYYDEEEDVNDDYYEYRRRQQRPRKRKQPYADYEDDYDEQQQQDQRGYSDEDKPTRRNNNRFRGDEDVDHEDYDEDNRRPPSNRPNAGRQNKPTSNDRRKPLAARKPGRTDERRSFNDDRPRKDKPRASSALDDSAESAAESTPRRLAGRRRFNEKRTSQSTAAALDDLDDYERPHAAAHHDQEEAAEEEAPQKVKTTPKPLDEFITPKAAPSSVYARPRAPPRIARPVPNNEKKKFQYQVQKATATTPASSVSSADEDDYYQQPQEEEYEDTRSRSSNQPKRRGPIEDEDEVASIANKRRKPTRGTLRKPVTDKKLLDDDDDYAAYESSSRGSNSRRRPLGNRARGVSRDDVDFIDDDVEEDERAPVRPANRQRPKAPTRKNVARPRQPVQHVAENESDDETSFETESRPQRGRPTTNSNPLRRNKPAISARSRPAAIKTTPAPVAAHEEDYDAADTAEAEPLTDDDDDAVVPAAPSKSLTASGRAPASVRVVKRPFLPSRGGSPYLPRGLQPVGIALKPFVETRTTESTPIDMGSTISGVRLLEHGAPILRDAGNNNDNANTDDDDDEDDDVPHIAVAPQKPRTTLPPRSALPVSMQKLPEPQPKVNLEELYENDYDVTLNDALDPTLKPLTPQLQHQHYNRNYASAYASGVSSSNTNGPINPFAHTLSSNQSPVHYQHQEHQQQQQQQHLQAFQHAQTHLFQTPSSSQAIAASSSSKQQPQQQQQQQQNYNSDSYFSSTDIRRRAIVPAQAATRSSRNEYRGAGGSSSVVDTGIGARIAQHFYDDFDY